MAQESKEPKEVMKREDIVKSQANYKGNQHAELVEVEIISDGKYLKKGQKKQVHPATAELLKSKGLIKDLGKVIERNKLEQKDVTVDS